MSADSLSAARIDNPWRAVLIVIAGELDAASFDPIVDIVTAALTERPSSIHLDCTRVTSADAAAFELLTTVRRLCHSASTQRRRCERNNVEDLRVRRRLSSSSTFDQLINSFARPDVVEVWRLLPTSRDIPATLQADPAS